MRDWKRRWEIEKSMMERESYIEIEQGSKRDRWKNKKKEWEGESVLDHARYIQCTTICELNEFKERANMDTNSGSHTRLTSQPNLKNVNEIDIFEESSLERSIKASTSTSISFVLLRFQYKFKNNFNWTANATKSKKDKPNSRTL